MKKSLLTITLASGLMILSGCTTAPDGSIRSAGCDTGTNYGGAAIGAIAGGALGSLVGGGAGNTLATVGGAALGGVAGSRTRIGC